MDLSGIFPALTTPYANDGSVSLPDLKQNIQRYNGTDLAGYVVLGSTGESVLLRQAEMDGILITVKESAGKEKKLIAGTGAESTLETIERTKRAAELGYHAALVKTPHYTGIALESPEVVALSGHSNIIGIKDSSGNVQRVAEMIAGVPPAFQVLVGAAATIYPSLVMGARGCILALACALPEKCVALFELVRKGHHEKARELQAVLVRASKAIVSESGIAGLKHVMDLRGYRGGLPRLPLLPLQPEQKTRLSEFIATLEPAVARA